MRSWGELSCWKREPITPRAPQITRMTHRRVRAGFAGGPCPLSPPSLSVHIPWAVCPSHGMSTPLPGCWPACSPFPGRWGRSESASPHPRVRSLFTATSNIYPKCRALAETSGPPALGFAAHPSSPLGHLLFIYFLEYLPSSKSLLAASIWG